MATFSRGSTAASMGSVGSMASVGASARAQGVVYHGGGQHACGPNGCGLLGDACLEPAGATTTVNWKYVGGGRGGYEKMTTMKYVGQGAGGFDKDLRMNAYSSAVSKFCSGFFLIVICAAGIYLGLTVLTGPKILMSDTSTNAVLLKTPAPTQGAEVLLPAPVARAEEFQFDCVDKDEAWGADRREWCCKKFGAQCEEGIQGPSPTPSPEPVAMQAPVLRPSASPQQPLASDARLPPPAAQAAMVLPGQQSPSLLVSGAPAVATLIFDCQAGLPNWDKDWSDAKMEWCCYQDGVGCKPQVTNSADVKQPLSPVASPPLLPPTAPPAPPATSEQVPLFAWKVRPSDVTTTSTTKTWPPTTAKSTPPLTPRPAQTTSMRGPPGHIPAAQSSKVLRTTTAQAPSTSEGEAGTTTITIQVTQTATSTTMQHIVPATTLPPTLAPKQSFTIAKTPVPSTARFFQPPTTALPPTTTPPATTTLALATMPATSTASLTTTLPRTTTPAPTIMLVLTATLPIETTTTTLVLTTITTEATRTTAAERMVAAVPPALVPILHAPMMPAWRQKFVSTLTPRPRPIQRSGAGVFDCEVGVSKWEKGWSILKKAWCCQHKQVACEPHDCSEDYNKWEDRWAREKRDWCCKNKQIGCGLLGPTSESSLFYECDQGLIPSWSLGKKAWCCAQEHLGCPSDEKSYDCNLGQSKDMWSHEKKVWCCKEEGLACP